MKKLLSLIVSLFLYTLVASAQEGLEVSNLFGHGLSNKRGVTENLMRGGPITDYGLSLFRSITLDDRAMSLAPRLEAAVEKDGLKAVQREGQRKDGVVYYSFYTLPPVKKGQNRYLFYLNRTLIGESGAVLIYMEGSASLEQIRKMLK